MKVILKPIFLFSIMLLIVLSCEFSYRAYVRFAKPLYHPSSFPGLGWEFTPGAAKSSKGQEGNRFTYLINRQGFRDRLAGEWHRWKPEEVKVAFIGDSVAAGAEVDYDDTFSSVAEKMLSARGRRVRTINLGVDATNTRQQAAVLKYKVLPLGPDLVILAYVLNDTESRAIERMPVFVDQIMRHFHLGAFLSMRLMQAVRNRQVAGAMKRDSASIPGSDRCNDYSAGNIAAYSGKVWDESAIILKQMADSVLIGGAGFGIVCFPLEGQLSGACPDFPQNKIAEFCLAQNIPFLDLLPVYRAQGEQAGIYVKGDFIHPGKKGHRLAAEAIADWILSDGRLHKPFDRKD